VNQREHLLDRLRLLAAVDDHGHEAALDHLVEALGVTGAVGLHEVCAELRAARSKRRSSAASSRAIR
jgi:hypothetical protein